MRQLPDAMAYHILEGRNRGAKRAARSDAGLVLGRVTLCAVNQKLSDPMKPNQSASIISISTLLPLPSTRLLTNVGMNLSTTASLRRRKREEREKDYEEGAEPADMGGKVKGKNQLLLPPPPPPAAARRDVEEEEEQIEEFFGLLKSIREMKDRRRGVGGGGGCSPMKKARVAQSTAWTPAFEWQDFADDDAAASKKRLQAAGAISSEDGGERKEGSRNTLDLNYLPL